MATRTIGTEIVLAGEKKFNDAMKGINNNIKNLRTDMAVLSASFDSNEESMDSLTAKQSILSESVEQHRAKVSALTQMYTEQKKKYGENSSQADKYRQQLNMATVAMLKEEQALQKTTEAIEEKIRSQKEAAAAAEAAAKVEVKSAEESAKAIVSATKAKEPYVSLFTRIGQKTSKVSSGFHEMTNRIKENATEAAKGTPVLAELMDISSAGSRMLGVAAKGAGTTLKGLSTAAGGVAKGVGAITAAAAAGVAAIGAGGVIALNQMANMAREAAEAAKAAQEAGETLTESQQQWLAYSNQLDALDASVANAKGALAGVLLPLLGDLSTDGAAFLNDFTRDMTAAAGDTGKQTQVLSDYIVKGVQLIKEKLPEYIAAGKELFSGLAEGLGENSDELLDTGLDLVMDLLDSILLHAPELAQAGITLVEKLIGGLTERGPETLESGAQMVSQIVSGLAQAAPSLIPAAVQLVMQLLTSLVQNAPLLLEAGLELIFGIISGILNGLGEIGSVADDVIDEFVEGLMSSESEILQFGGKVIDWIRDGISNAWSGLVSWFNGIWDSLFDDRTVDVTVNGNSNGSSSSSTGRSGLKPSSVDGNHASGLDYVPFDGYLARLHRGETVLTAAEAAAYRRGRTGQTVKQFNLTIHTQSLSKEELDMIVSYVNGKLGDDL